MNGNDWRHVGALFAPRFEVLMPQSGEAIRSLEDFVGFNDAYPAAGMWQFSVTRLVGGAKEAVTEVGVTDGARHDTVVSFFTVGPGGITRIVEYWPDPMPAPDWRRQWVEPI